MIHPTRTILLQLKEKAASTIDSVAILKARRQTLIREFLDSVRPFVRSRDAIKHDYNKALAELYLSKGHEGETLVETLAAVSERELGVDVRDRNLMGVRYRELTVYGPFVRSPEERDYDYTITTPHLEESIYLFERIVESMLEIANFENKLKMLGEEILQVTRRARILEERMLPKLKAEIRTISQYIEERDRETHFRLKRFKDMRVKPSRAGWTALRP